jgi:hypothetical protein
VVAPTAVDPSPPGTGTSPGGLPAELTRADSGTDAGTVPVPAPPAGTPTGALAGEPVRPRVAGAGAVAAIFPVLLAGAIVLVLHVVWHGTETDWFFATLMWLIFLGPMTAAVALTGVTHAGGGRNRFTLALYLLAPPVLTVAVPIFFLKSWDDGNHQVRLFLNGVDAEWSLVYAVSLGLLAHAWMKRQGIVSRVIPASLVLPPSRS